MRYGTRKPTGPWTLTFRLRTEPYCPGCAEFLQPAVVEVRAGWAWCPICAGHALHAQPHLAYVLEQDFMHEHTTIQHGVLFYTPRVCGSRVPVALDLYEYAVGGTRVSVTPEGLRVIEDPRTTPPRRS